MAVNGAWPTPEWEVAKMALEKLQENNDDSSGSDDKSTIKSSSTGALTTTTTTIMPSTVSYDSASYYSQYYAPYQHPYAPYGMYGFAPYGPYGYMSFAGPVPQQMQPPPPPPPSAKNDAESKSTTEQSQVQAVSSSAVSISSNSTSSSSDVAVDAGKKATTSVAGVAQTTWPTTSSVDSTGAQYSYPRTPWQPSGSMSSSSFGMWDQFQSPRAPCSRPKSSGTNISQSGQTATPVGGGSWQQSPLSPGDKGRFSAGTVRPSRSSVSSAVPSLRWSQSPRTNPYDGNFRQAAANLSSEPYSPFDPTESEESHIQPASSESFHGFGSAPDATSFRFRMPNRGANRPMQWRQQLPRPRFAPDMHSPQRGSMQHSPSWRLEHRPGHQQVLRPNQGSAGARPVMPRVRNPMPRPRIPWTAGSNAPRMHSPVASPDKLQQSRWDKKETAASAADSNKDVPGPSDKGGAANVASPDKWPDSLKLFVHRCFSSVNNDRDRDMMEVQLKELLTPAFGDGSAFRHNWDLESIPVIPNRSPSVQALSSPPDSQSYGRSSSSLRSPTNFKIAGTPRGRRGAVGRRGLGYSAPALRRRSRSRSHSRRSRSRSSSRSSSSSRHLSRQRRHRHRRRRDSR